MMHFSYSFGILSLGVFDFPTLEVAMLSIATPHRPSCTILSVHMKIDFSGCKERIGDSRPSPSQKRTQLAMGK